MNKPETVYCQIPTDQLPRPGTAVQVELSNGMMARVWNIPDGQPAPFAGQSRSLHYVPARAVADLDLVHATINRRVHGRNRTTGTTLCSKMGADRLTVSSIVAGSLADTVTCPGCRRDLTGDGMF